MSGKKQYGLIPAARKKQAAPVARIAKTSVFGDSSSDEDDTGRGHVNTSLRRENEKRSKQMRENIQRAMEEDPSVYEYDSLYDSMVEQRQKADPRQKRKEDNKPRYIESLKRYAERRKIEHDIAFERKAQKELEQEGAEFGDKETFLTSAYRQKLKERAALERELQQEEETERANDVKKQKDLSRFYRHMLDRSDDKDPPPTSTTPVRPPSPQTSPQHSTEEQSTEEQRTEEQSAEERGGNSLSSEDAEKPAGGDSSNGAADVSQGEKEEAPKRTSLLDMSDEAIAAAKEERKRIAFAKRTDDQALGSAKERYLARKKARLVSKQQIDT